MNLKRLSCLLVSALAVAMFAASSALAQKRPNVVMLMSDDVGWGDYGVYHGGAALGTPRRTSIAGEGRRDVHELVRPGQLHRGPRFVHDRAHPDPHGAVRRGRSRRPERPRVRTPRPSPSSTRRTATRPTSPASGILGDVEKFYPINVGFDEMKQFAAYYPGVYGYEDLSPNAHPFFPKYNKEYWEMYQKTVNRYEWEGTAGKPAVKGNGGAVITLENLADFDVRQTESAVTYIKQHAKDGKPFFMSVNFMGMHQPTSPNKAFVGKSRLGNYSDKMLEMDYNIGRIMDAIRAEAPDTIVIHTADNGAWQDAWPDAGTNPFRGEKGTGFEGAFRVPGIMWAPGRIPAGQVLYEMMSHMDVWPTTATMVGLTPPPHGEWKDNNGKPIYFDGIDNTAYVTGKAKHSARNGWIYTDGEKFLGMRADVGGDPENPDLKIAWKMLYTSKDTWLGPELNLGAIGSTYNLTMDPYEKYDMTFNGAVAVRNPTSSPGRYSGMDNGWAISLGDIPLSEFNQSIVQYPNKKRFPGGASNDMIPNLQNPEIRCPTIRSRCRRPSTRTRRGKRGWMELR